MAAGRWSCRRPGVVPFLSTSRDSTRVHTRSRTSQRLVGTHGLGSGELGGCRLRSCARCFPLSEVVVQQASRCSPSLLRTTPSFLLNPLQYSEESTRLLVRGPSSTSLSSNVATVAPLLLSSLSPPSLDPQDGAPCSSNEPAMPAGVHFDQLFRFSRRDAPSDLAGRAELSNATFTSHLRRGYPRQCDHRGTTDQQYSSTRPLPNTRPTPPASSSSLPRTRRRRGTRRSTSTPNPPPRIHPPSTPPIHLPHHHQAPSPASRRPTSPPPPHDRRLARPSDSRPQRALHHLPRPFRLPQPAVRPSFPPARPSPLIFARVQDRVRQCARSGTRAE